MKGKIASTLGAALAVSALVLGGCVGDAADEEEATTAQSGAALVVAPLVPKSQGGTQASPGTTPVPASVKANDDSGGDPNEDPEPSSWDQFGLTQTH